MSLVFSRSEVERFRALIGRHLGLEIDDDRLDSLSDILRQRLETSAYPQIPAYFRRIAMGDRVELRALAERLTVSETYFFRYWDHFRAFAEVVLPSRVEARKDIRALRILSAGCSSGEEAHSIAILVRENLRDFGTWDLSFRGIDVNPIVLEKARRGRYSPWSLRGAPEPLRERYFRTEKGELHLDDDVRSMVSFDERNLVDSDPLAPDGSLDVVFCRNVTMYFTPEIMRAVVGRIHRALAPGGYLFMGHAESLRAVSQGFHLCHTHDTFYYQRREGGDAATTSTSGLYAAPAAAVDRIGIPADDASWVDVIRGASERIATLSRASRKEPAGSSEGAALPAWDLRPAVEMLRLERFSEAIAFLGALPPGSRVDPDAQLLRAVALLNGGRLGEAEKVCEQILSVDELNAGAHYLTALCREHAHDLRGAMDHDQSATYLDGEFAMPHLHLGLLARRSGDTAAARNELGRALTLLEREDASRIVLFGGGCTREALVALCRSELRTCGGDTW